MKRVLCAVAAAALMAMLPVGTGHAQTGAIEGEAEDLAAEGGRLWLVELAGAPAADGGSVANVQAEKAAFRRAAASAGLRFAERRSFDTLFNGLSISIDPADRHALRALPGVKAVWPVRLIRSPAVRPSGAMATAHMTTAITMTGADIAFTAGGVPS